MCGALGFYSVTSVRRSSTCGDAAVSPIVHRLRRQPVKRGPLDPPRDWIRRDAVEADREVRTIDTPPPRSGLVASVVTFVQVDVLGSTAGRARWHVVSLPAGVGALGRGADGQHSGSVTGVNSARTATNTAWGSRWVIAASSVRPAAPRVGYVLEARPAATAGHYTPANGTRPTNGPLGLWGRRLYRFDLVDRRAVVEHERAAARDRTHSPAMESRRPARSRSELVRLAAR